ncbi:hypothetical protein L1887_01367 [Cichorium endivia]|nr:hypothetical protein L1887_01367 [Cichorium endivia]
MFQKLLMSPVIPISSLLFYWSYSDCWVSKSYQQTTQALDPPKLFEDAANGGGCGRKWRLWSPVAARVTMARTRRLRSGQDLQDLRFHKYSPPRSLKNTSSMAVHGGWIGGCDRCGKGDDCRRFESSVSSSQSGGLPPPLLLV